MSVRTVAVSGLVAAFLAVAAPAAPVQAKASIDYADAAVAATNNKRENHDLRRLRETNCLQEWANRQARRMARKERIFHQDLTEPLQDCDLRRTGENVAVGFTSGGATVSGWMDSPTHRANILDARFRKMAIAARKGDDGRWYVAQVFGRG